MSAKKKQSSLDAFLSELPRHWNTLLKLLRQNREAAYQVVMAILAFTLATRAKHPLIFFFTVPMAFLVATVVVARITGKVDKAFQSIPLDYNQGYGKPYWLIEGAKPLKSEIYRIHAAGYTGKEFENYKDILAARLREPISSIVKESVASPVIIVNTKKTEVPSYVAFEEMPLNDLKTGEFFLGKSEAGFVKISLSKMIHMLVAGQTGAGKTQFLKQMMLTLLLRTKNVHICMVDMKGGIDFQDFMGIKNLEFATDYQSANSLLDSVNVLFEKRKAVLLNLRKTNWSEITAEDLRGDKELSTMPTGPVVVIVDELAELTKKTSQKAASSDLQEKIAQIARLARFTGIHLVLGTQRPDVKVINSQSKDNLPTKVCFSVPNVSASTLVVGNMTASTLGGHPGRAVVVGAA